MFGGRSILQVEPINNCNLDCDICLRKWLKRPLGFMDLEGFRRFLNLNMPIYVAFHGWGEPLLHDQIYNMISYASSKRIQTSLITNGTLINKENAKRLLSLKLKELAFGVYRLRRLREISEKIKLVTDLKSRLRLKEPKIFLDITVYGGNRDDVLEIVEEAPELRIEAINLHRIFNLHQPSFEPLTVAEEMELFQKVQKLTARFNLELVLPKRHVNPCRIAKYCIFLTWDFRLTPCCFMSEEYLADGLEVRVKDVVKSKSYRSFIKNMEKHPICSRCVI